MANQVPLRGFYGLDANDNPIINVKRTTEESIYDAINLEYFIEKNSIQTWVPGRTYPANFITIHKGVIYEAKEAILATDPAPDFYLTQENVPADTSKWKLAHTAAEYIPIDQSSQYNAEPTRFYDVNTQSSNLGVGITGMTISLPPADQFDRRPGISVWIRDAKKSASKQPIRVNGSRILGQQKIVDIDGQEIETFIINVDRDEVKFTWNGAQWEFERQKYVHDGRVRTGTTAIDPYVISSYERASILFGSTLDEDTYIQLPRHPKHYDILQIEAFYKHDSVKEDTIISVDPNTAHVIDPVRLTDSTATVPSFKHKITRSVTLVYDSSGTGTWTVYGEPRDTSQIVAGNAQLNGAKQVILNTINSTSNITVKMPPEPSHNDVIELNNVYGNRNCNITMQIDTAALFYADPNQLIIKKYSAIPTASGQLTTSASITLDGSLGFNIRFRYLDSSHGHVGGAKWWIENISIRPDAVDYHASWYTRHGLIQLASSKDAVAQLYSPDSKTDVASNIRAITPYTLDNRRATDTLAGLGRIAKESEVLINNWTNTGIGGTKTTIGDEAKWTAINAGSPLLPQWKYDGSGGDHRDDIFLTPLKLAKRVATELRTGILALSTDQQTKGQGTKVVGGDADNFGTPLHDKIVTPQTLDRRRATEKQTGLVRIATKVEIEDTNRNNDSGGTGSGFSGDKDTELGINPFHFHEWLHQTRHIKVNVDEHDSGINKTYGVTAENLVASPNTASDGLIQKGTLWSDVYIDINNATEAQRGTVRFATLNSELFYQLQDTKYGDIAVSLKGLDRRRASETQTGISRIATDAEVYAGNIAIDNASIRGTNGLEEGFINPTKLKNYLLHEEHIQVDQNDTKTDSENTTSDGLIIEGNIWDNTLIDILAATEAQRGTARFATTDTDTEILYQKQDKYDDLAVSLKGLDRRRASSTQTGIARIATDEEVVAGAVTSSDSIRGSAGGWEEAFINPTKFKNWLDRDVNFVIPGGGAGEGTDGLNIVEGDTLWNGINLRIHEATQEQRGTLEVATQEEADSNTTGSGSDIHIITPKKLNARRSTETLHGIARIASTTEVTAGTLDGEQFINPLKLKTWLDNLDRIKVNDEDTSSDSGTDEDDGLYRSNTLWAGVTINMKHATEDQRGSARFADVTEAKGSRDDLMISAAGLNARNATDTQTGIAALADADKVNTATDAVTIVTPSLLDHWTKTSVLARSTANKYGTVQTSTDAGQWSGGAVTKPTEAEAVAGIHNKNIYANPTNPAYSAVTMVTPQGLNKALSNYLPRHSIANDSWQLGGQTATYYNNTLARMQEELDNAVIEGGTTESAAFTSFIKVGDMTISSANGIAQFTFD